MGWEGQTVGIADQAENERAVVEFVRSLTACAAACGAAGLACEVVSCGGTGRYAIKVESVGLSAEHARITRGAPADAPRVGDKIALVVGYSDTTTMLHDEIYGIRDGRLEVVWPILGRGKLR